MGHSSRFLLGAATTMLVLLIGALVAPPAASAAQSSSALSVSVQFGVRGGAHRAGGRGGEGARLSPAVGVAVWAVPAGGPVLPPQATASTDAAGVALFTLPAGSYWVVVPRLTTPPPGIPGGAITRELPEGTLVQGWTRVELAADSSADASILLTVPLP